MTSQQKLANLQSQNRSCKSCIYELNRIVVVPGVTAGLTSDNIRIMLVSDYPGASEDNKGIPFSGRSGNAMRHLLFNELGFDKEEFYLTNVIKCIPVNSKGEQVRPSTSAISKCATMWLNQEIDYICPVVIISAGGVVTRYVTGEKSISVARTKEFHYKDVRVFPTYNPVALLSKDEASIQAFKDDVIKAVEYSKSATDTRYDISDMKLF